METQVAVVALEKTICANGRRAKQVQRHRQTVSFQTGGRGEMKTLQFIQ